MEQVQNHQESSVLSQFSTYIDLNGAHRCCQGRDQWFGTCAVSSQHWAQEVRGKTRFCSHQCSLKAKCPIHLPYIFLNISPPWGLVVFPSSSISFSGSQLFWQGSRNVHIYTRIFQCHSKCNLVIFWLCMHHAKHDKSTL